jgi:2-succinyl-5-enolpyruvyl-6-hydroxy-3-cyclohexene-1-carboxylate synthase
MAGGRRRSSSVFEVDPTNRNTALASALVEELARAGVEHACVAPGSRSAPLALALWNEPAISVWSHVDERCAGFFALGIAQRTGKPAVVLTTSGTAAANLHPAVAEAAEARLPLIAITADRPPELRGRGAGQTIDQIKLYGSAVRWFCELGVARADDEGLLHYRSAAARAVAEAIAAPPGPVHLNVPLQEPLAPVDDDQDVTAQDDLALHGRPDGSPLTTVRTAPRSPNAPLVDTLAGAIDACPRGVVLAGRQRDAGLAEPLAALACRAGYPLLAEPTSQLRAGHHDRSHVIACYDALLRRPPSELRPELVLRFGDMVTSKATREWLASNPRCRQFVIDAEGGWNDPTWAADEIVRADPQRLCHALLEALPERAGGGWLRLWLDRATAAERVIDDQLAALGDELFEPRIHRELAKALPAGAIVYVSSSMPVRDLETFFPSSPTPLRFLANRGANGIDGVVSSGFGAGAAHGEPTFVLLGDVALYHDMNGLLASKRLGLKATVVVMDNGGGGIFDFLPIAEHRDGYEQLFATPTGLDVERVAALYGLPFRRVESYDDLPQAMARPGLVQVPLDRARNVELHRELFANVAEAVGTAAAGRSEPAD